MSLGRKVLAGTGAITVAGGVSRLLAIATVPILTPLLGPVVYGAAALVITMLGLASMLALLGIDMSYARFYLQEAPEHRSAVERYCWRFAACGVAVTGALVAAGWLLLGHRWLEQAGLIALFSVAALALMVMVPMMTTRVRLRGEYARLALSLVAGALVSAAFMILAALFWRRDVWVLLLGTAASSVGMLMVLGVPGREVLFGSSGLDSGLKRAVRSMGVAGAVTAPAYWIISSGDRWLLALFRGPADIGVYSIAASIAAVGLMLNNSITMTWFPEASRIFGQQGHDSLDALGEMWARLVAGLGVVWVAITAAGGDLLRLLADESFHGGARYIPWLAGAIFFYGVASLANTSLFLSARMRLAAYAWAAGAALAVALNLLVLPRLGAYGAAVVQCASLAAIAGGVMVGSQRILFLPMPAARLTAVLCGVLAAGVFMAPAWTPNPLLSLLAKLPVGFVIAVVVLRISAPDWYRHAGAVLRRRVRQPIHPQV